VNVAPKVDLTGRRIEDDIVISDIPVNIEDINDPTDPYSPEQIAAINSDAESILQGETGYEVEGFDPEALRRKQAEIRQKDEERGELHGSSLYEVPSLDKTIGPLIDSLRTQWEDQARAGTQAYAGDEFWINAIEQIKNQGRKISPAGFEKSIYNIDASEIFSGWGARPSPSEYKGADVATVFRTDTQQEIDSSARALVEELLNKFTTQMDEYDTYTAGEVSLRGAPLRTEDRPLPDFTLLTEDINRVISQNPDIWNNSVITKGLDANTLLSHWKDQWAAGKTRAQLDRQANKLDELGEGLVEETVVKDATGSDATGSGAAGAGGSGIAPTMGLLSPQEQWSAYMANQMGDDIYNPTLWGASNVGFKPAWQDFLLAGGQTVTPGGTFTDFIPTRSDLDKDVLWRSAVEASESYTPEYAKLMNDAMAGQLDPLLAAQRGLIGGSGVTNEAARAAQINMAMSYMNAGTGMGASAIENTLRTLYDPWAAQQQAAGLPPTERHLARPPQVDGELLEEAVDIYQQLPAGRAHF
jgi:hypothetical protein